MRFNFNAAMWRIFFPVYWNTMSNDSKVSAHVKVLVQFQAISPNIRINYHYPLV